VKPRKPRKPAKPDTTHQTTPALALKPLTGVYFPNRLAVILDMIDRRDCDLKDRERSQP
jgi:hypothetical protein